MVSTLVRPRLRHASGSRPGANAVSHFLARQTTYRQRYLAMGTTVTVTVVSNRRSRREVDRVMAEVQQQILAFGRDAWAWGPGALSTFNQQLLAGKSARVPRSLKDLFDKAWAIRSACHGLFEPRIAALVRLWGFDDPARLRSAPPDTDEIARLMAALAAAPDYDGSASYGPAPDVAWDFGAIGKGWIVDQMLDLLARSGFPDATIDAGGHVGTRGFRDGRPWRVGIRDPFEPGEQEYVLASVQPGERSVVTHGDEQRCFEHQGRRYAHLLDSVNGWPVQGLRSLTVVHADGALADAAGAALFVAGQQRWPALAHQLGLDRVLALNSDGEAQVTPMLAAELAWKRELRVRVVA